MHPVCAKGGDAHLTTLRGDVSFFEKLPLGSLGTAAALRAALSGGRIPHDGLGVREDQGRTALAVWDVQMVAQLPAVRGEQLEGRG